MFHFNTNKPQSFFSFFFSCRIPVVLESHRSSRSYSPNISHMKDCTALKLGDAFCIFTFFHFPVSGLYVLHDRLWFLSLNAWLSENQRQNAACALWLRKARVYEVEEMCIIFKDGWKLLAVKQVPHPSATFSLTSYPKPSKNQIILLHPNHSFLCFNGQGKS